MTAVSAEEQPGDAQGLCSRSHMQGYRLWQGGLRGLLNGWAGLRQSLSAVTTV